MKFTRTFSSLYVYNTCMYEILFTILIQYKACDLYMCILVNEDNTTLKDIQSYAIYCITRS